MREREGKQLLKRKFFWYARLYKDARQVAEIEPVRISHRPRLVLHATADKSWCTGGGIELTFFRDAIEPCDEIWLGCIRGEEVFEEWELLNVKEIPRQLYTSHIPGDVVYEDNEGEKTVKYRYETLRWRPPGKKWTNFSNLHSQCYMDDISYFKATYGLRDCDLLLVPYGSRVYGTNKDDSDYDYIAIVPANRRANTGEEFVRGETNIHIYNRYDFTKQLAQHKIHALEAYFLPSGEVAKEFSFNLNLITLRHELCQKASHSFVKAKKKIDVEHDHYVGWKSLFHSLRILTFGIQLGSGGKISDYSAANHFWLDIRDARQYNWEYFKVKYQPIYNSLATEFRKLAPKE